MSDVNREILIRDLAPYAAKPVGSIRIDMADVRSILDMNNEIVGLTDAIAAKDREIAETRQRTIEECASVAYRVCAETRHVTLGDKAAAAIRSLGKEGSGEANPEPEMPIVENVYVAPADQRSVIVLSSTANDQDGETQ